MTEDLSCQFFPELKYLISAIYPKLLSEGIEGQQLQQHVTRPCRGGCVLSRSVTSDSVTP